MRTIPDNAPKLVGIATFVIVFLIAWAVDGSLLIAFVIALPLSIADYLIVRGMFPRRRDAA
jgi:hypothetical protein